MGQTILDAARAYQRDVADGTFPGPENSTEMDESLLAAVLGRSADDRAPTGFPIPLDRDL